MTKLNAKVGGIKITFHIFYEHYVNGDLRELPRVSLRGEGSCGVGGAPRDSAGPGATEEGLTSREAGTSGFLCVSDSDIIRNIYIWSLYPVPDTELLKPLEFPEL